LSQNTSTTPILFLPTSSRHHFLHTSLFNSLPLHKMNTAHHLGNQADQLNPKPIPSRPSNMTSRTFRLLTTEDLQATGLRLEVFENKARSAFTLKKTVLMSNPTLFGPAHPRRKTQIDGNLDCRLINAIIVRTSAPPFSPQRRARPKFSPTLLQNDQTVSYFQFSYAISIPPYPIRYLQQCLNLLCAKSKAMKNTVKSKKERFPNSQSVLNRLPKRIPPTQ